MKSLRLSRQLAPVWGPRGRQLVEDILATLPPALEQVPIHVVLIDPRSRRATWAASRNAGRPIDDYEATYDGRSEEHTSELQSPAMISYAVFCLKKKKTE